MSPRPLRIAGTKVEAGTRARVELPVARLFTDVWLNLPVTVVHGKEAGPSLWLDAAIHGDELNGMEVIRRVLEELDPQRLQGTLLAVPVVNVFGFVQQDRYLPDRRDLNRSFPGSAHGSTAARLAHLFMQEIVSRCHYGIDLHTGSLHRNNLPQIRAFLEDLETRRIAEAFGAPMLYQAPEIRGSLRSAARHTGAHVLVYEAGGPLRFDPEAIATGVAGVFRVLATLEMWTKRGLARELEQPPFEAASTRWIRAARSGICYLECDLGQRVVEKQTLGVIRAPFTRESRRITAPFDGLVIGHSSNPLAHQGDALIHLARERVESAIPDASFAAYLGADQTDPADPAVENTETPGSDPGAP